MTESAGFASLRAHTQTTAAQRNAAAEPQPPIEARAVPGDLAEVRRAWSEVLGVPVEELADDFFKAGGSSLPAMRLAARLGLSLREVFALRTQAAMAGALARKQDS